jgi:peptide chain release factor 1
MRDPRALASLGRERQRLDQVVEQATQLHRLDEQLAAARELFDVDDVELAAEARDEVARLTEGIGRIEAALKPLLIPHDPLDDRPAIVEIRAGTGGDEAALFAYDLHRMYTRFAERKRWRVEHLTLSEGALGGLKEAVM